MASGTSDLLNCVERDVDDGVVPENLNDEAHALSLVVDGTHRSRELRERPVSHQNLVTDL